MPAYTYRCPRHGAFEHVQSIHDDLAELVQCPREPDEHQVAREPGRTRCAYLGERVIDAPIAVHFKGRGFYSTDVKATQERRRRPNPGDDLHREHDPGAAAIARSL